MNTDQKTYRPAGHVVTRRIGEDRLLVPVSGIAAGGNAVFPVNDTGLFVWEHLLGGKTIQDTARNITEVFAIDFDIALADCKEIVRRLLDEKLLEEVSA